MPIQKNKKNRKFMSRSMKQKRDITDAARPNHRVINAKQTVLHLNKEYAFLNCLIVQIPRTCFQNMLLNTLHREKVG